MLNQLRGFINTLPTGYCILTIQVACFSGSLQRMPFSYDFVMEHPFGRGVAIPISESYRHVTMEEKLDTGLV